ncbi:MAG: acetyl-CoA carboxylase carboxyl transferase subunit alpha, partial [Sphingomonadaceae bacterium]
DLLRLGVIQRIVYEPVGGAHRDHNETFKRLSLALRTELDSLTFLTRSELCAERRALFMQLGAL